MNLSNRLAFQIGFAVLGMIMLMRNKQSAEGLQTYAKFLERNKLQGKAADMKVYSLLSRFLAIAMILFGLISAFKTYRLMREQSRPTPILKSSSNDMHCENTSVIG